MVSSSSSARLKSCVVAALSACCRSNEASCSSFADEPEHDVANIPADIMADAIAVMNSGLFAALYIFYAFYGFEFLD